MEAVREHLRELNIWFQEEVPETTQARTYYLDFVVVGLSGARYDIEVDGRQHFFTAAAIAEDASRDSALNHAGYKVVRLQAADVTAGGARVRELLGRLA